MKDMGEARYVLGIEIIRNRFKRLLGLSQEAYINKVLEQRGWTPVEKGITLCLDQYPKTDKEKERMNNAPYASTVGSLMYAMLCTRTDICSVIGLISRYQSNLRPAY